MTFQVVIVFFFWPSLRIVFWTLATVFFALSWVTLKLVDGVERSEKPASNVVPLCFSKPLFCRLEIPLSSLFMILCNTFPCVAHPP